MAHNFYCGSCGRWVANCGFSNNNHSETFSFSTTCGCGNSASGSCGGKSVLQEEGILLFDVKCKDCGKIMAVILGKENDKNLDAQISCANCHSKEIVIQKH